MSSNRNIRNPQQLRSLIQNMGRSIDEARSRRLGPQAGGGQEPPAARELQFEQAPQLPVAPRSDASRPAEPNSALPSPLSAAPPVRAANEMFEGATPRLKARPKRAS